MRGRFSLPHTASCLFKPLDRSPFPTLALLPIEESWNRGTARNWSENSTIYVGVCALPRTRKEGRKEGSKTWLTVDHRSHQDTSSLPPSLFLSLRFTDRGTPPPSIILLSRETPLSLSLSYPVLARPGGEKAFSIAVGTKLWSRNCAKQGKTKRRKNPAPVQTRAEGSNATKVFPLFLFPFCPSRTRHLLVITPVESSRLLARFSN